MILDALRYPLIRPAGRRALLAATGALLGVAVALRFAAGLYPVVLALAPAALALVAVAALAGTMTGVALRPASPLGSLRRTAAAGAAAIGLAALLLALPVALLVGSILSAGGLEGLDSGLPVLTLLGSTSALVAFFAATYTLPVVVAGAVAGDGIAAGFQRARLRRTLGSLAYFLAWTIGLPLVVLGWGFVAFAVASASLGGLLSAAIAAYCLLAGAHALGAGYRAAPGNEPDDRSAGATTDDAAPVGDPE